MDSWNDAIIVAGQTLWDLNLGADQYQPTLEPPTDPKHGDATCGVALRLAKTLKKPPRKIAEELVAHLKKQGLDYVGEIDIAGPGFINFRATENFYTDFINAARREGAAHGRSEFGENRKVLIEHTSANPTGPLHIAHGRQAAVGDALARTLTFAGYEVHRDYYLNDAGKQVHNLGLSLYARWRQKKEPEFPMPENGYHGDYIIQMMEAADFDIGSHSEEEAVRRLSDFGKGRLLEAIKNDVTDFRVSFDTFYSESTLQKSEWIPKVLDKFRERNLIYEKDGALWLRAEALGDAKDWVLKKSDGTYTYRTPDFGYHLHKFERGFETVIDLLGPDHHAAAETMKLVMKAFGHDDLRVILVQHCRLLRDGKEVSFSKREGNIVTLRELFEETGVDAARYFFIMRKTNTPLDFDIEVAKKKTLENPVYYIQNAHARVCSVWKKGVEKGLIPESEVKDNRWTGSIEGAKLGDAEIEVLREAGRFRRAVEGAARELDTARVCNFLHDLAGRFHRFYQNKANIILADDRAVRLGRMAMCTVLQTVLHNGLDLLGVEAPTFMEKLEEPQ